VKPERFERRAPRDVWAKPDRPRRATMTNNISLPQSPVVNHGGVEFANLDEHHYVRADGEWVCISKADYNMIVGRVQAEPMIELRVKRECSWLKFWLYNGIMSWIEVPLATLVDPGEWSMLYEVSFPEFGPERLVAQDPEPDLNHPFAFVDGKDSKGYFIRVHGDGDETTWVRISKADWERCRTLFHSNHDDDPEGEFYNYTTIAGVVATDAYNVVRVNVNPMGERGEIEFYLADAAQEIEAEQAAA
jgi:hypothetical protein